MTDVSQDQLSYAPMNVTIDGVEYEVSPISKSGINRAAKRLKSSWLQFFLDGTRMIPLPSEDRSKAIADISCRLVTYADIISDYDATLFLFSLHVKADGKPLTYDYVQSDKFNGKTYGDLTTIMFTISAPKGGDDDDPLVRSTSTTKSETHP